MQTVINHAHTRLVTYQWREVVDNISFPSDTVVTADLTSMDFLPTHVRRNRRHEPRLTAAQLKVIALVATGLQNKQIAHALQVSEATVKAHVNQAMKRIGLFNRVQLAVWHVRRKLAANEQIDH